MQMKVTVLGSGAWGTALAIVLVENGNDVTMWSHRREAVAEMQQLGVNPKLKDVPLPKELHLSSDLSCVSDSDVVVFATPSFAMRETAKRASSLVRSGTILVSVGKGIEKGSDLRMSQVIRSEISDDCPLVVLCGPTHAEEVGRKIPSGIVAASENQQAAEQVQDLFMNKRFRVYTSSDVVGVEICAALKNVIALCVGMSDGMGFGDNTRALIITRGLAEITRLGTALGGRAGDFRRSGRSRRPHHHLHLRPLSEPPGRYPHWRRHEAGGGHREGGRCGGRLLRSRHRYGVGGTDGH